MAANIISYLLFLSLSAGTILTTYWYAESWQPIVELPEAPHVSGYESGVYIDVHWIAQRKNLCPAWNQPIIISTEKGGIAESLYRVPMLQYHDMTDFTRRYYITLHLAAGRYIFRHELRSQCNPLFNNQQIIDIPFEIPLIP